MRIDSFLVASVILLSSLLVMVFTYNYLLFNLAYGGVLASMVLFVFAEPLDWLLARASKDPVLAA